MKPERVPPHAALVGYRVKIRGRWHLVKRVDLDPETGKARPIVVAAPRARSTPAQPSLFTA